MKYLIALSTGILFIAGYALMWSLPTFILWNWLMPIIFGLPKITWLQALGVNILSNILFKPSSVKIEKD